MILVIENNSEAAGGGGAVRAAGRRTAPRQRTRGEPIFVKNWGEPAGLESAVAARHAGPCRDEPSPLSDAHWPHRSAPDTVLRVMKRPLEAGFGFATNVVS